MVVRWTATTALSQAVWWVSPLVLALPEAWKARCPIATSCATVGHGVRGEAGRRFIRRFKQPGAMGGSHVRSALPFLNGNARVRRRRYVLVISVRHISALRLKITLKHEILRGNTATLCKPNKPSLPSSLQRVRCVQQTCQQMHVCSDRQKIRPPPGFEPGTTSRRYHADRDQAKTTPKEGMIATTPQERLCFGFSEIPL